MPVTVLRAPVGYGKSTLLAQWLRHQDPVIETVAWLRVGPGRTDPAAFWVSLVDALTDAGLPLPPLSEHRSPQALAERMLTANPGSLLLALDGFDVMADAAIDERLLDLVWRSPGLRLIVCLRSHDHFAAETFRDLDAAVVGAQELLFTAAETAELFARFGVSLAPKQATQLHAELGGWPELTKLLASSLRDRQPQHPNEVREAAVAVAANYLHTRLIPEMCSPACIDFALMTSLADEFSLEIAELLSGDASARSHVELLEREGMLHVEASGGEAIYRWPPAARNALRAELTRRHPDELAERHSRLARRYAGDGRPERALHHALEAQDWPLVVAVIDSAWRQLFLTSYHQLQHAFVATPMEVVETSTRALAVRDIVLHNPDDWVLTRAALPTDPGELADLGHLDRVRDLLDTGLAMLISLRWRGLFDHAREYGDRLLVLAAAAREARPDQVMDLLPNAHLHVGHTRLLADDLAGALQPLQLAYDWAPESSFDYVEAACAGALALAHAIAGETQIAATWLHRHESAPPPSTWLAERIRGTASDAKLLIDLDRLVLDRDAVVRDPMTADLGAKEFATFAVYAQAQRALHTGAMFEALALLDRVRASRPAWLGGGTTARPLLAAAEGDLLLALGKGNQAQVVLQGSDSEHPLLRVGQARLALLSGNAAAALRLSTDMAWTRAATTRSRLEMLLIRAVAAYRTGNRNMAAEALHRAVGAASAAGSLRAFATVPRADVEQIAVAVPAAAALLAQPALASTPDLFPAEVHLVELTEREQRVLETLAGGLTLQRVADALVVSYNTVKTQQRSLYRKLSVGSRPEAIARARQWGLL